MLILASASPRRHELLTAAGIPHHVSSASIPEIRLPGEPPRAFVTRLAREKAQAVPRSPGDIVLGADTVVALDDQIFGKPQNEADARRVLQLLSGRPHLVYTGIAFLSDKAPISDAAVSTVIFATLSESEISEYTQSEEPFGKAGSYAIQGLASKFVLSVEGSYTNVVGLPVALVYRHLKALSQ